MAVRNLHFDCNKYTFLRHRVNFDWHMFIVCNERAMKCNKLHACNILHKVQYITSCNILYLVQYITTCNILYLVQYITT